MGNTFTANNELSHDGQYESVGEYKSASGEWVLRPEFSGNLDRILNVLEVKKTRRNAQDEKLGGWEVSPSYIIDPDCQKVFKEEDGNLRIALGRLQLGVDPKWRVTTCTRIRRLAVPSGTSVNLSNPKFVPVRSDARKKEIADLVLQYTLYLGECISSY